MHDKTSDSTLVTKTTRQAIIVVVMSYDHICSTVRAVTVVTIVDYVSHTMLQYQVLIDRIEHVGYIPTVL